MYLGLIPKFSEYLSCFNSKRVLVLLRLQYVIPAKRVSVLHPRAAVVMGNVPQCWSSQQLWALWQVMLELKAMWRSPVLSVLPHCSHWKKDLKEAYKFCQISFWQILEVISLGISCCFVKLKWYCHVVTRQCCEENHKRVWSIQIP